MRYWFDTEFIEYPHTIDLISVGMVREDGDELYLESSEVDWSKASPWVLENVQPHLSGNGIPKAEIAKQILAFAPPEEKPQFWGYYCDYDWVVFCWLFGKMVDLPKGYPMHCLDVKQYREANGIKYLPPNEGTKHNALDDARWTKAAWEYIKVRN